MGCIVRKGLRDLDSARHFPMAGKLLQDSYVVSCVCGLHYACVTMIMSYSLISDGCKMVCHGEKEGSKHLLPIV